ncbi:hypothetical protein HDV06_006148 [Boothiomyces sp. JEL0866]|nr:hypothetical protein HDV06_006148 [Boothiomyces sp. JEL0866]
MILLWLGLGAALPIEPIDPGIGFYFPSANTFTFHKQKYYKKKVARGQKLTLLHTNDIHSHMKEFNRGGTACLQSDIEDNKCFGGIARIKYKIDEIRNKSQDLVLFDAGDQFQGTLFFNIYGGEIASRMMNLLQYNAMSIGNHEFDRGTQYLTTFIKNLTFPVLSSNIDFSSSNAMDLFHAGLQPYTIIEKHKLGIIGYITKTTNSISSHEEVKNTRFMDPVAPVQKLVEELQSKGIKKIICVSHNGYWDDQELARNTRGIDLIVGGHSHTLLSDSKNAAGPYPTKIMNKDGKSTYIVQAHRYGDYLGHLELEWDLNDVLINIDGKPILLDQTIPQDQTVLDQVNAWANIFAHFTNKTIAYSSEPFPSTCTLEECEMGNLITDCMVSESPSTDVGLINSGSIRATFGTIITLADLMTAFPFGNSVVYFTYSGNQIKELLERIAAAEWPDGKQVFGNPQFSGLKYTISKQQPKFQRVSNILIAGNQLMSDKNYTIATLDYVSGGGDNILNPLPVQIGVGEVELLSSCLSKLHDISPKYDIRVQYI